MHKFLLALAMLFAACISKAQYSHPYRIAYDDVKKSYMITNRGNGTLVLLDSFYQNKTVVTGLKDPRDLVMGTFGGNSGLLLIDNNSIVAYETNGFGKLISFPVNPATEIEDIEIDLYNQGYFYLSDPAAGKILKGKIGPPPFYTPTFNTLASGLNRPKGLLLDSKGRLLVVSDDTLGQIIQIDTANGNKKVLMNTGLDSLNHLVEDGQGNFFITNWDNSYVYRIDPAFSGLTKLTSYNHPSGMYVNADQDLFMVVCFFCNKLEFQKLHYFEPAYDLESCSRDSVYVVMDVQANGIGTYKSGNSFLIEVSDKNGSFAKPTTIGSAVQSVQPAKIGGLIPNGNYGTGTRYRIRSTNPSFTSSEKSLTVYSKPDISKLITDSLFVCKGSSVNLGSTDPGGFVYQWSPANGLDKTNILNAKFTAQDSGVFQYKLFAENKDYDCSDSGVTVVSVTPDIRLSPWKRQLQTCFSDSIDLGIKGSDYSFKWSPYAQLSDANSPTPKFFAQSTQKYQVEVEDLSNGCYGKDSVEIVVNALPVISIEMHTEELCRGDSSEIKINAQSNTEYKWKGEELKVTSGITNLFFANTSGVIQTGIKAKTMNGCLSDTTFNTTVHPTPVIDSFSVEGNLGTGSVRLVLQSTDGNSAEVYYSIGDSFQYFGSFKLPIDSIVERHSLSNKEVTFYAVVTNEHNCESVTGQQTTNISVVGIQELKHPVFHILPNPADKVLRINSTDEHVHQITVLNCVGEVVVNDENLSEINTSGFESGVYFIRIIGRDGQAFHSGFIVNHR